MTDLATLVVRLEAQTAQYDKKLEQATAQLRAFKRANDSALAGLGSKLAAAFSVGAVIAWGRAVVDNASTLNNLSQATGVSVESLSALQYAAKSAGVPIEGLSAGLRALAKTMTEAVGNASSEAAAAFAAMGVALTDSNGRMRATDAVLADVADRFASYRDGAQKSALAQAILGRGGADLIPVLNGGAAGLKEMADRAREAGLIMSTDTAKGLDDFGNKLGEVKDSLVLGLGSAIAEQLLPSLNNLGNQWDRAGDKTRAYQGVAEVVANFVRVMASAVLVAGEALKAFGTIIGAVAAAAVAAVHGNFTEAKDILAQLPADLEASAQDNRRRIAAIWSGMSDDQLDFVKVTAKRWETEAPNVTGAKALGDAATKARDKLRDMYLQMTQQVAVFDKGSAAAVRFRLTVGDMADDVKAAGTAGQALANGIIAAAEAMEKLERAKEIASGLADVNAQIAEMQGNTETAALIQFDQSNLELRKKLAEDGNTAGLAQLDTLRNLVQLQAQYNALNTEAARIQSDLALAEERIRNSREAGAITELGMLQQLAAARTAAGQQLAVVADQMQAVAAASGSPEQLQGVRQLGGAIDQLASQTDLVGQKFKAVFEDGLGSAIEGILNGTKSVSDAMKGLLADLEAQLAKMVAQDLVGRLFSGAMAAFGGGGGGGIGSFFGALFGGGRDSGGRGHPGNVYAIGRGAQPELFVPDTAGTFYPRGAMGGANMTVNQNFTIQAPAGSITRATQQQAAAAAARGLAMARRRNT